MRRFGLIAALVLACATTAIAVDLNSAKPVKYVAAGGYAVLDSVANGSSYSDYEPWYLFVGQASEDIYIRRYFDGAWESAPGVFIPAGKSLVINVPYTPGTTGYQRQLVQVSTLTDTLVCIPWVK